MTKSELKKQTTKRVINHLIEEFDAYNIKEKTNTLTSGLIYMVMYYNYKWILETIRSVVGIVWE